MLQNINIDDVRTSLEKRLVKAAEECDTSAAGHTLHRRSLSARKYLIEDILIDEFGYTFDEVSSVYDRKFGEL